MNPNNCLTKRLREDHGLDEDDISSVLSELSMYAAPRTIISKDNRKRGPRIFIFFSDTAAQRCMSQVLGECINSLQ